MNYLRMVVILTVVLILLANINGQTVESVKPADALDEMLRANAHPIQIKNGELSGQGAKLLADSLDNVQFVALGEAHNKRAVHQFGEALFRFLHEKYKFNYLALEEDSYWGKLLSQAALAGGTEAVFKLGLRYPNAFHLYTEDEMKMIGDIGKISSARKNAIWGLNQIFGAAHVYERLVKIAPNAKARETAQKLLDDALEYEKERFQKNVHYLVTVAKQEDFQRLRETFKPAPGSEAAWLIEQTALSNRIFAPYAAKPSPSSAIFYESGKTRETNMKRLFSERYKEAQNAGEALPKVLAMFGQLHLYRGLSEGTQQYTLGNFLSELANFNNNQSFHIYSATDFPEIEKSFIAPLAKASGKTAGDSDFAVLIDLRPLFDYARHSKDMDPQLRRLIMSYDVFLFLRDSQSGSIKRLETPNFHWYPGEK